LWRARRSPAAAFARAKLLFAHGAFIAFLVGFLGFLVIGGEWFAMWQSSAWNGQESAFRLLVTILLVMLFVLQPEEPA